VRRDKEKEREKVGGKGDGKEREMVSLKMMIVKSGIVYKKKWWVKIE